MNRRTRTALGAAAALSLPAALLIAATPAQAAEDATVSVLHGIPAGNGADVVDIYAGDAELLADVEPGDLATLEVPAGSYDLAVYADGDAPGSGDPLLSADGVEVPAGANATVTANLDADGAPTLNVFVNDTASVAAGEARLVVRHVAAAPAVDVRANGDVLFSDLTNPNEATADVPAASYEADVVLAGTDTVAIGPATVDLAEGTSTIVYAWGSAEAGDLALAVQTIDGLGSAPAGVPAGDGSLAGGSSGVPAWTLALMALAAIGVVGAGARLAVRA
ncbi:MAG: DUF4397 domain-containing protein [Candidatus Nanopelagicales bacterium]